MVSIIVPSLGRPSLGRLVKSLQAGAVFAGWRSDVDFEIVVSLDPRARAPIFDSLDGVRVVQGAGTGVNCARNEGARTARGEIFWFLDDDTELAGSESLEALRKIFANETVEAAGGDYLSPTGGQWLERGYNLLCSLWRTTAGVGDSEQLLGGTLAVRKEAWIQAGGFDEHIAYGGAETPFVQRLRKGASAASPSKKIIYDSDLDVLHHPGNRGLRTWMALAYRQGSRAVETAQELPEMKERTGRAFHFLSRCDVLSLVTLITFSVPYLFFSCLGRMRRR